MNSRLSPLFLLSLAAFILSFPVEAKTTVTALAPDQAAGLFMAKCSGCHTVGGGKLTGPDLEDVAAWKVSDLLTKIKTMETKVGPLKPEEIQALAQFLKDPKVTDRIATQKVLIAQAEEAKYEKGDAVKGGDFFFGRTPFTNGGLACTACHRVGLKGGSLGPDLSPVFTKMGAVPLVSACEKTPFRLMDAAYRERPITHQEAIHLEKFLETAGGKPIPEKDTLTLFTGAAGLGFLGLGGMSAYYRKKKPGRRAPERE